MTTFTKRNGGWRAMIRIKGYPTVTKTFDMKSDARAWAGPIEREMKLGEWRGVHIDSEITLAVAIDRYLEKGQQENKRNDVRKIYCLDRSKKNRLENIKQQSFARYALGKLPAIVLIEWRDERLGECSPSTVTNDLNHISKLYKVARREWQIYGLENPLDDVTRPGRGDHRTRRLDETNDEENRIFSCASSNPHARLLPQIIIIAIETGMRRGELASIRPSYIDIADRVVHLPKTKNGSARDVPLSPKAIEALHSFQFPVNDGVIFNAQPDVISHAFRWAVKEAEIEDLHFHDLRHEAISRFLEQGYEITEVASIVGHKTLNQLLRYTHHKAKRLADRMRVSDVDGKMFKALIESLQLFVKVEGYDIDLLSKSFGHMNFSQILGYLKINTAFPTRNFVQ